MKKLTILATAAILIMCGSAMAITITVQGTITAAGVPLQVVPGSWGPNFDYENIGVNPLIDILVNGGLVGQTTVGAGQFVEPVNGKYSKGLDVGVLNEGDVVSIRAYTTTDGSGLHGDSIGVAYAISIPPAPSDSIFDLDADIPIPEPSLMLSGLALLLLRKKK